MFSIEELRFAACYPFSETAKSVIREKSPVLERIPSSVIRRAALWLVVAAKPRKREELERFFSERAAGASETLSEHVLAFPVAKILASAAGQPELLERVGDIVSSQTFFYLSREERADTLFSIANELDSRAVPGGASGVFAKVALSDFMQANTREDFLKLVNVALENGTVFLDRSAFVRFLSELAARRVTTSLPVPLKEVPSSLIAVAGQLKSQLAARQKAEFDLKSLGVVEADAFPPCMAKMYSELLSGKNANHAARFNLATFLAAVGMPLDQMVDVYRHAPNFDEKVTRYQLGKIAGKGKQRYSPSSCAKMREYELCVANCPVSHPIQFYRRAKGSAPLPKEADGADAAMPSDASSAPTAVEGS